MLYTTRWKRNVREIRKGNQEWTISKHWQYWAHKTQDEDKTKRKNTMHTRQIKKMSNTDPTKNRE